MSAVRAALASVKEPLPRPRAFVRFEVRECLLLAGPAEAVLELAATLRNQFDVVAAISGPKPQKRLLGVSIVRAERVLLTGYLGQFFAQGLDHDGKPVDLSAKSTNDDSCFDLVVDLTPTPILDRPVPPLGYLRPGDPDQSEAALESLTALHGEFRKPRYYNFDPALCVHRRQQVAGCDRCLAVCPAAAIASDQQTVKIDPHLCRGCGTCTAVCPTGALTYADPPPSEIIERLERMLRTFRIACDLRPWVGFFVDDSGPLERWAATRNAAMLPFEVRAVSAVGLEIWLAALCLGAAGVALLVPGSMPKPVVSELTRQTNVARKILEQLGQPPARIRILDSDSPDQELDSPEPPGETTTGSWSFETVSDLRTRLLTLFGRLWSGSQDISGVPGNELPAWATFGCIALDQAACTMCLACVSLCPTGSLRTTGDGDELGFIESACVQCGLCEHGCPERAIKCQPRFDYRALRETELIVLNRARMESCLQCGKPFISAAMLNSALQHLSGDGDSIQWAREMLRICPRCRADNALSAQFPGIPNSQK